MARRCRAGTQMTRAANIAAPAAARPPTMRGWYRPQAANAQAPKMNSSMRAAREPVAIVMPTARHPTMARASRRGRVRVTLEASKKTPAARRIAT